MTLAARPVWEDDVVEAQQVPNDRWDKVCSCANMHGFESGKLLTTSFGPLVCTLDQCDQDQYTEIIRNTRQVRSEERADKNTKITN